MTREHFVVNQRVVIEHTRASNPTSSMELLQKCVFEEIENAVLRANKSPSPLQAKGPNSASSEGGSEGSTAADKDADGDDGGRYKTSPPATLRNNNLLFRWICDRCVERMSEAWIHPSSAHTHHLYSTIVDYHQCSFS